MAGIEEARKQYRVALEAQREELSKELEAVKRELASLGSTGPVRRGPGRKASTNGRRRSKGRKRRGGRGEQVKSALRKDPKASASKIAEEFGMSASQVHGIFARLEKKGEITKTKAGRTVKA